MPKVNCDVAGCSSSTCGINKWKKEPCLEHGHKNVVKEQCPNCERPYRLYCFPDKMTNDKERERDAWIQALKRENPNKTKWIPKSSDRICSLLPIDGISTKANPLPTMHMGYDTKRQKFDALFSNTHYQQRKCGQRKVKWKL